MSQVVLEEIDPDCIPKPGDKPSVHARDCCDIRDSIPESIKQAHLKCIEKIGLPPRPTGVPTGPPPLEALNKFASIDECVFQVGLDVALHFNMLKTFRLNAISRKWPKNKIK